MTLVGNPYNNMHPDDLNLLYYAIMYPNFTAHRAFVLEQLAQEVERRHAYYDGDNDGA